MKNSILIYCLLFSTVSAQENRNIFNLILRSGIGTNKLFVTEKAPNPSIPTTSKLGLNLSIGSLIEYNYFSKIQFSTGIGFKLNKFRTRISGITTNETLNNGFQPIEIYDTYILNYLSIPFLVNFRISNKFNLGGGVSYDYLLNKKMTKSVKNTKDPVFGRSNSIFHPANHSVFIFFKFKLHKNFSVLPTFSLSPHRTTAQSFYTSTGPSASFDLHFELKI